MLTNAMEWCGLLVNYCDGFICGLNSHSDGTHLPIHWWTSDNAKFLQICSDEETNSSTSWMSWEWLYFQFRWTIPFSHSTVGASIGNIKSTTVHSLWQHGGPQTHALLLYSRFTALLQDCAAVSPFPCIENELYGAGKLSSSLCSLLGSG